MTAIYAPFAGRANSRLNCVLFAIIRKKKIIRKRWREVISVRLHVQPRHPPRCRVANYVFMHSGIRKYVYLSASFCVPLDILSHGSCLLKLELRYVQTSESISMHFAVGAVRAVVEAFAVLLLALFTEYFIFNRKKSSPLMPCHLQRWEVSLKKKNNNFSLMPERNYTLSIWFCNFLFKKIAIKLFELDRLKWQICLIYFLLFSFVVIHSYFI